MVMEKLHPHKEEEMSLSEALSSGVESHHAEGVRMATLQAQVEYLRHFDERGAPRDLTPMPKDLRLPVLGRTAKENIDGDPKALEAYLGFLDEVMARKIEAKQILDPDRDPYSTESFQAREKDPMKDLFSNNETASFAKLLMISLKRIDGSGLSKVEKMSAFFKAMVFLGGRATSYYQGSEPWLGTLSESEQRELAKFLVANAVGHQGWRLKDFQSLMEELPLEAKNFIVFPLIGNEVGQNILSKMIKVSTSWKEFFNYIGTADSFFKNGEFYAMEFSSFLNGLLSSKSSPGIPNGAIRAKLREIVLESLQKKFDPEIITGRIAKDGNPEFSFISFSWIEDRSGSDGQWVNAIEKTLEVYKATFRKKMFALLQKQFQESERDSHGISRGDFAMEMTLANVGVADLSTEELRIIEKLFIPFMRKTTVVKRQAFRPTFIDNVPLKELVSRFIEINSDNRPLQLEYLKFILVSNRVRFFDFDSGRNRISASARHVFEDLAKSLRVDKMWQLVTDLNPVEVEVRDEIIAMAKKYHAQDFGDLRDRVRSIEPRLIENQTGLGLDSQGASSSDGPTENPIDHMISWGHAVETKATLIPNLLQFIATMGSTASNQVTELSAHDFKLLLRHFEFANYLRKFSIGGIGSNVETKNETSELLMTRYLQLLEGKSFAGIEDAFKTFERILRLSGAGYIPTLEMEQRVRQQLQAQLNDIPVKKRYAWLKRDHLRKALGAEFVGQQLAQYVLQGKPEDRKELRAKIDKILREIPLREKWPDAYEVFRNQMVEGANIQPQELSNIVPEDRRSTTQKADVTDSLVRAASAFSSMTRTLSHQSQIQMIEFIMGRSTELPEEVNAFMRDHKVNEIDLPRLFSQIREELKYRTVLERALVVDSVLAGPNGLLANPSGKQIIKDHIMKSVAEGNRDNVSKMVEALDRAEGGNISIFFAYALAQKSEAQNKLLSEGVVFRAFLDFYGVPGVKLAQYLAFTSELKEAQASMEQYQDAAMPISYYDALQLIKDRLGEKWNPMKYKVIKIIGSGSVNIAIELLNLETGKSEVVSIGREKIEIKTKEDFRRFRNLLRELTITPELEKDFGFVVGLVDIIQRSVALEFDKELSFRIQNQVQELYHQTIDGWHVQSVRANSVDQAALALYMDKAPGKSARKIFGANPEIYKSAMAALMKVEYDVLRGVNQKHNWLPIPLHANPDVHDGQVLIDVENRTVTILDFGQALPISNEERDLGLDLLLIVGKGVSVDTAIRYIERYSQQIQKKRIVLSREKVKKIFQKTDRMDIFVHLLSHISESGFDVPLASIHWVLGANRLIKLGEKIGHSPESSLRWLLGFRKFGLPTAIFNWGEDVADVVERIGNKFEPSYRADRCLEVLKEAH